MENTLIGHYRVTGKLGEGGMGAVYRATDTKLARDVAIKVLPEAFTKDPERLARFTREAQVLASLNHPNIATIHGIEEGAIVMELVEGPTLQEKIARGPLELDEALSIARQIAEALESAHDKGIIHRDLKPANVKVTPEGNVKVLDFGLAKLNDAADPSENPATAPTVIRGNSPTLAGMIMGTAGYMAPEQASGKAVDKRADIWSFGVVLHEMLTGRTLFDGESIPHTLASVLKDPIAFETVQAPEPIRRLLMRCLERNPKNRLRDIGEARVTIQNFAANPLPEPSPAPASSPKRPALTWALAALIPLAAFLGWLFRSTPPRPAIPMRFELPPPSKEQFAILGHTISPDGRQLLVRASSSGLRGPGSNQIYLRDLNGKTYRPLPGTLAGISPVWSPDGKSVLFAQGGKWRHLEIGASSPVVLCDADSPALAAWGPNGTILLGSTAGPVRRIAIAGGTPAGVTKLDPKRGETGHAAPQFLPGGQYFLYTALGPRPSVWVASIDGNQPPTWLLDIEGSQALFAAGESLTAGLLLFHRGGGLAGVGFDASSRKVLSAPMQIVDTISNPVTGYLPLGVSIPARVMVYNDEATVGEPERVVFLDRHGKTAFTLPQEQGVEWGHMEFSPDGRRLMLSRFHNATNSGADTSVAVTAELWTVEVARGTISRVTFDGGSEKSPAWSPDGRRVYYTRASEKDPPAIWSIPADGAGKPEKWMDRADKSGHHIHVSPDGRHLVYPFDGGIRLVDLSARGKTSDVISAPANFDWPQFSPDGRWLAYISNETGRSELYVQSFPPGRGKWQVSRNGATLARWRRDQRTRLQRAANSVSSIP
ncbi:MAG: protein kinase [Bryobacteraceae bacterium]